jgi:HK97 gp10 family phage protein
MSDIAHQLYIYKSTTIDALNKIGREAVDFSKAKMSRVGIVSRTGNLRDHISYEVVLNGDDMEVIITDSMDYASYVNDGTYKMKARPFIMDSLSLDEIIVRNIEDQINRSFE